MKYNEQILKVREVAKEVKKVATLPCQENKKKLWLDHNMKRESRPLVMIGDVPWHEVNVNDELTCISEDPLISNIELNLRRTLYRWNHMPGDMVVEDFVQMILPVENLGYGIQEDSKEMVTDPQNSITSRHFSNQLETKEDILKIKSGNINLNQKKLKILREVYNEIFDGILDIKETGVNCFHVAWDLLISWRGVENTMIDMIDRPDFIHSIMDRITDVTLENLDKLEKKGLLAQFQPHLIFAPAYYDWDTIDTSSKVSAKNAWTVGLAQILGSASKKMHEEFELPYAMKVLERFGNAYYGCCEPLDDRIDMIRKMPNVRKISISPWAKPVKAANNIGSDYIMSRKPNPAYVASGGNFDVIKKDLKDTYIACKKNNTKLEYILKDISTVEYKPQRLWRWADEAMKIAMGK